MVKLIPGEGQTSVRWKRPLKSLKANNAFVPTEWELLEILAASKCCAFKRRYSKGGWAMVLRVGLHLVPARGTSGSKNDLKLRKLGSNDQ